MGSVTIMLGFLNVVMATTTQRIIMYAEGDKEKQTTVNIILYFLIAVIMVFFWMVFNTQSTLNRKCKNEFKIIL